MNFPSHSIATALGDLTPEFLCSEIDDSKSWGEIWHHFSNQMYKFCHPPFDLGDVQHNPDIPLLGTMKERPPRNWNQHFCRSKRLLKYGLVFTPVEENGYGPFQLRHPQGEEQEILQQEKGAVGEQQYVAKYLRGDCEDIDYIETPSDLPDDGSTPMLWLITPFIPQAHEDCITLIGSQTGKGTFSTFAGYRTKKIDLDQTTRDMPFLPEEKEFNKKDDDYPGPEDEDGLPLDDSSYASPNDDELRWHKADQRGLRNACHARVNYGEPHYVLTKTDIKNVWNKYGSDALGRIVSSAYGKKKSSLRFNKHLFRIKMFRVKPKTYMSIDENLEHFRYLRETTFVTSVELLNLCYQDFHHGFCEDDPPFNATGEAISKIESVGKVILEYIMDKDKNGWNI